MKNTYEIQGDTTIIHGRIYGEDKEIIIDTDYLSLVSSYKNLWKIGIISGVLIVKNTIKVDGKKVNSDLARVITDTTARNMTVRHLDGNRLNFKIANLQPEVIDYFRRKKEDSVDEEQA